VEVACSLGLADGIVDLVETGTTMRAAGLEMVAKVCYLRGLLVFAGYLSSRQFSAFTLFTFLLW
jgi:ATP phosphoribosyltransferase